MAFPYDTPFTNNDKVDLDTYPAVPAVNKVLATEYNTLTSGANALATAITAGQYHGLSHNATPPMVGATGVILSSRNGVLEAAEGGSYDANSYPVRSYFPGSVQLEDTTTVLMARGGVVSFIPFDTSILTAPLTLVPGPQGPIEFDSSGGNGLVTLLYASGASPFYTVTIPQGVSCSLRDGVDFVMHVRDAITLAYSVNHLAWFEVSRSVAT